ncbi:MAG: FHA domain-containing protein [Anaerolineae bacterium]
MADKDKANNESQDTALTQNIPHDLETGNTDMLGGGTTELMIASFYLPGHSDPIIISGTKTIVIGRRDPKRRINPTLDLTEDYGAKLGVSRMHAEMNYVNGKYYIKDTGSANGTWVNDTKLQPFQPHVVMTGDQIRIGQLAIVVHLSLPQNKSAPTSDAVVSTVLGDFGDRHAYRVVDDTGSMMVENGAMIMSKIRNLSTYLERLIRIHAIIREAQQQESPPFSVVAIRVRQADEALIVEINEGEDLMNFMANKLPEFISVLEGKTKGDKKQTDSLQRYSDPLERIADYALQELVFRFLNETRDEYVSKLAIHFDAIRSIELSVTKTNA